MLFSRKPKPVIVRIIDLATDNLVGKISLPPDELPPSFETTPVFRYIDIDWQVLDAQPPLAADYTKRGEVTLYVRQEPNGEPGRLYGSPTVAHGVALSTPGSTKVGVRRYQLLPEDWRQVEFVSLALQPTIDGNFEAIRAVAAESVDGSGFTAVHVREGVDEPFTIDSRFSLDELISLFEEGVDRQDGLTFLGIPGLVDGGFAFVSASLTQYYGIVRDGIVTVLGLGGIGTHDYESAEVQALADFAYEKGLTLVDWAGATQRNPDTDEFFQFFDTSVMIDETAPV